MRYEIAIKIHNSNPGNHDPVRNWRDGMPAAIMPEGLYVTPAEMLAWKDSNVEPPQITALDPPQRRRFRHSVKRTKYLTNPARTAQQVAEKRFGPSPTAEHLALAQEMIDKEQPTMVNLLANGFDTNWGTETLKKWGILLVDINHKQARRIMEEALTMAPHVAEPRQVTGRKNYVVDYESLVGLPLATQWRDPTQLILVDRMATPVDWSTLKAAAIEIGVG